MEKYCESLGPAFPPTCLKKITVKKDNTKQLSHQNAFAPRCLGQRHKSNDFQVVSYQIWPKFRSNSRAAGGMDETDCTPARRSWWWQSALSFEARGKLSWDKRLRPWSVGLSWHRLAMAQFDQIRCYKKLVDWEGRRKIIWMPWCVFSCFFFSIDLCIPFTQQPSSDPSSPVAPLQSIGTPDPRNRGSPALKFKHFNRNFGCSVGHAFRLKQNPTFLKDFPKHNGTRSDKNARNLPHLAVFVDEKCQIAWEVIFSTGLENWRHTIVWQPGYAKSEAIETKTYPFPDVFQQVIVVRVSDESNGLDWFRMLQAPLWKLKGESK